MNILLGFICTVIHTLDIQRPYIWNGLVKIVEYIVGLYLYINLYTNAETTSTPEHWQAFGEKN
jgi:hypothetical protein